MVSFLNSFSRSTQCEIILPSGVKIVIEGNEWKNITKEGVGFFINDNGRKTYEGQEIIDLMAVKLYENNKIFSKLQIKEIISSDEKLNILYNNASLLAPEPSLSGEQNQTKYYDEINGRKIIIIGSKYYCTSLEDFIRLLFDYLNEKEYLH